MMVIVCNDDSRTWRNCLTKGKEYAVLRSFSDSITAETMFEILRDDGKTGIYAAERFKQKS